MSRSHVSLLCLSILLFCEPALAHSSIESIGDFYNGLLHPILVPAHLLLLLAVGLFWEQQGLSKIEQPVGAFGIAMITGLVGAWFAVGAGIEALILAVNVVLGLLLALSIRLKKGTATVLRIVIALLGGFLVGIDSAQEELTGRGRFLALFGSCIAIFFLALYPMALADHFRNKEWKQTGVRIIGSWIAASSILVLALSFAVEP